MRGFTLIELMIVMAILSILAVTVLPNIFDAAERRELITTTNDVAGLLSTARNQALASKADATGKLPTGGYGVYLTDVVTNPAGTIALFVDDWNAALGKAVNTTVDPSNVAGFQATFARPDTLYTAGSDTLMKSYLVMNKPYLQVSKLEVQPIGSSTWVATTAATVLYVPPYATTHIYDATHTDMGALRISIRAGGTATSPTRQIKLNRVTTTPQIIAP